MPGPARPTPPSSTSSANGLSPEDQPYRVVRKRNRVPLSCAPCRHRKLKCNRGHPCDNCSKRGDTGACSYAAPGSRKKGGSHGANSTPDDMQNRIDRLEGLVLSLMTNGGSQVGLGGGGGGGGGGTAAAQAAINGSRNNSLGLGGLDLKLDANGADMIPEEGEDRGEDGSEVGDLSQGIGIMRMNDGKAIFASDAHWYAILGEISEVKKYFNDHKEDYMQHMAKVKGSSSSPSEGAFLLQGASAKDRGEVMAAYPSKADADRLIARYFNAYDPSVHIIHGPSFQKQYDKHWLNPNETSVVWLGMCFAMMTLALQSYNRAGDEPPEYRGRSLELSHEYRKLTAQCLLLSDITQGHPQTLETLVLHVQAEYGRSRDAEPAVLLLTGICVRLAMRMGYHRDPGPYPGMSPFEGEMRRRVWTLVRQCDLLISFQFGLPAMIRSDNVDTEIPRNLYDDELYEEMKSLPPSRQVFEATPMSYMITKAKMTFLFGRIVERAHSVSNPPSYDETLKFDAELREARASHPPLLQMRSFQESARDPANLIMQRFGLEMVYLRSLFVLHRKFIAKGRENPRFSYSRRTCLNASMELLDHQATLHREGQPGGRLRSVKWYISSLTTHDFLLAAMLVCLDLYHTAEDERTGRRSTSNPSSPLVETDLCHGARREEMMQAVGHCITIWESVRDHSMEAFKASTTLRVMMEKLKAHTEKQQQHKRSLLHREGGMETSSSYSSHSSQLQHQQQQQSQQQQQHGLSTGYPQRAPNYTMYSNNTNPHMSSDNNNNNIHPEDDNLPPEQSAAMTLGMLSSGGISPGPGFGLNMSAAGPEKTTTTTTASMPSYPASMAALLNDDPMTTEQQQQQYNGGGGGSETASPMASPMSSLLANAGGGFMGMGMGMGDGSDIDWGAWDSYIQGTNMGMELGGVGVGGGAGGNLSSWPMMTIDADDGGNGNGNGHGNGNRSNVNGGGGLLAQNSQGYSQAQQQGNGNAYSGFMGGPPG